MGARFANVTDEEIRQMNEGATPANTKKATKFGVSVFNGKNSFFRCYYTSFQLKKGSRTTSDLVLDRGRRSARNYFEHLFTNIEIIIRVSVTMGLTKIHNIFSMVPTTRRFLDSFRGNGFKRNE